MSLRKNLKQIYMANTKSIRPLFAIAVLLVSLAATGFSQGKSKTEFNLTLRDGSIVSGTSSIFKVDLSTDFGKLAIPVKNVTSIDVGIKINAAEKEKIQKLIIQLSNSNEQMRNSAHGELSSFGIEAIPVLNEFIYSEKYDPSAYPGFSPENVLNELSSVYGVNSDFSEKDIVSIDYQFSMGGEFAFDKIDLKTEYGNLSIPKNKIKRIEIISTEEGVTSERIFKLMGAKHISGNPKGGWLSTGISVKAGQKLDIIASGEVTLESLSGQKYKPSGVVASGGVIDNVDDYGYETSNYPAYGNVVYKIGDKGTMNKAGDKFSGVANASGILFLSIYETVYNAANTGSYNVKVIVR